MEHGRHVFYRVTDEGVPVSRILHERMLPEAADISDEDRNTAHHRREAEAEAAGVHAVTGVKRRIESTSDT